MDGDESASAGESDDVVVTIGLPSANPVFAELWVAQERGYFADEGVGVKVEFSQGAAVAGTLLQAGKTDMTLSPVDWLPAAVAGGGDLVSVYQQSYSPAFAMVYPEGSKYQSVGDLAGANVGVVAAGSASALLLKAELVKAGVDPENVTMTPIGVGATANTAIQQDRVDAAVYSIQNIPSLEADGITVDVKEFTDLVGNYPGGGFVIQRKALDEDKDALLGVLRAFARASQLCGDDLDACVDSYIEASEDTTPREDLLATLGARKPLLTLPADASGQWGYTAESYWQTLIDLTPQPEGMTLPEAADLYSTELLDEIDD